MGRRKWLLLTLFGLCFCNHGQNPPPETGGVAEPSAEETARQNQVRGELARYDTYDITYDASELEERDRAFLGALARAAGLIEELNMLQIHPRNLEWRARIMETGSEDDRELFRRYQMPWCHDNEEPSCVALAGIPERQVGAYHWPEGMTDEEVMLVTDMLPTGYFGAENGDIQPGDTVAVFGCGPVGLCAQICAQLFGPSKVFAVDLLDYRLEVAEKLGSIPINASEVDAVNRIRELTDGLGVNVAIEAIGLPATFYGCLMSARVKSNISVIGIFSDGVELPMQTLCITNKRITMGLPIRLAENVPGLIKLIQAGKIDTSPIISHILPLSEGERAYDMFANRSDGALKIILKPGE